MKTWKIAVVGAGNIAAMHAAVIGDLPNAELVGICDSGSGRAAALSAKYNTTAYSDYRQLMEDETVDIITIATPSGFHAEPAIAAAQAGKHVLCEKPMEISIDRIDAMIAAHEQAGTTLGCIFQNRFTDSMTHLRRAIGEGRFGRISYVGVYVPWWRSEDYYVGNWRGTWRLDGGGALMNQSIHMIDMLCDLMPEVLEVKSFCSTLTHDIETEDTSVAILRFANDALGVVYGTTAAYPGGARRFEICGSEGMAVYTDDRITSWQFADTQPGDQDVCANQCGKNSGGFANPMDISNEYHKRNFAQFLEALEQNRPFILDGKEARKSVALILDIYKRSGVSDK